MYFLNYKKEIELFNERNEAMLALFPLLNEALDKTFKQISPNGQHKMIVYALGRLSARHFEAIMLLCMNGLGFSAMRVLRSMFEKVVDGGFINNHKEVVDDFVEYYFLQLKKTGFEDFAKKVDPDFLTTIEKFKNPKSKGYRMSWSKDAVVTRAKECGFDDFFINYAYRIPNEFVHSSLGEIVLSFRTEEDGTSAACEDDNPNERRMADACYKLACPLLVQTIILQIAAFELPDEPLLGEYQNKVEKHFVSLSDKDS